MKTAMERMERITQNFVAACAETAEWRETAKLLHKRVLWLCNEAGKTSCPSCRQDCQYKDKRDDLICGTCWLDAVVNEVPSVL